MKISVLGVGISLVIGALVGFGLSRVIGQFSERKMSSSPAASQNQDITSSIATTPAPTAKLVLVRKTPKLASTIDFDVVYRSDQSVENLQGLEVMLHIKPGSFGVSGSAVNPESKLVSEGLIFPLKSLKIDKPSGDGEVHLLGFRGRPQPQVSLTDGEVLATVHLSGVTESSYLVTFDKNYTKIIFGNVVHVNVLGEDATLYVR